MSENNKLKTQKNLLPVKAGDDLLKVSNLILKNENPEEWYQKGIEAEIPKPDFAIYCFDRTLLFNNLNYKADFRLAYLNHRVNQSLFLKHWEKIFK